MQKLRHNGEKQPDLKAKLRKYLNSKTFQKAFRRMVSKTIENGTEHRFQIQVWPVPGRPRFLATAVTSTGSPDSCGGEGQLRASSSESHSSYMTGITKLYNKYGPTLLEASTYLIRLHTHPFSTRGEPFDDPVMHVPSPSDVEGLIVTQTDFGMVVPVDIFSKKIEILVFQHVTPLSHVAYENIWEEADTMDGDFDRVLLRLATERSILRVLELRKRKKAIITPAEVDLILEAIELKR